MESKSPQAEQAQPSSRTEVEVKTVLSGNSKQFPVLRTRNPAAFESASSGRYLPDVEGGNKHRVSAAERRNAQVKRRRQVKLFLAVALGIAFPPILAVYLIVWLMRRSKPPQKSMQRVRQATTAIEKKQTGIALQRLQEAHLLDPGNLDALYWLGLVLMEQQRYGQAIEALSLVSERASGVPEVEGALQEAYYRTGDYENAIHHAQQLLDTHPHDLTALVRMADSFEALGQIDEAIASLLNAPLYKRTLTEPLKLVHYRLGALYERKGDMEKALHYYRRLYTCDASYRDLSEKLKRHQKADARATTGSETTPPPVS